GSKSISNRITASIRYNFLNQFTFQVNYLYQKSTSNLKNIYDENAYYVRNLVNTFSQVVDNKVSFRNIPLGGILYNSYSESVSQSVRGMVSYNREIGNHSINVIAGAEVQELKTSGNTSTLYGYSSDIGTSKPVNFNLYYPTYPTLNESRIQGAPTNVPG